LGEFKVPTASYNVEETTNDTEGIFDAASSTSNAYDQLEAQLNKANEVPSSDKVDKAIDNADSLLSDANYAGPKTTTTPPSGTVEDDVCSVRGMFDESNSKGCL
jgi:hypothetical protein